MKIAAEEIGTRRTTRIGILVIKTVAIPIGIFPARKAGMNVMIMAGKIPIALADMEVTSKAIRIQEPGEMSAILDTMEVIQEWEWDQEAVTGLEVLETAMAHKVTIPAVNTGPVAATIREVLPGIAIEIFMTGTTKEYHGVAIRKVEHV
jgi:hypothetical protein